MRYKGMFTSKRIDWETPPKVFDPLHEKYRFTLDVCATPKNAKLPKYFTPKVNGLIQSWHGHRCWMNPPYGTYIKEWVKKAALEGDDETLIVGLVPSRTDTQWWHKYVIGKASHIQFIKGRVKFVGAPATAPFPSAIVTWGTCVL